MKNILAILFIAALLNRSTDRQQLEYKLSSNGFSIPALWSTDKGNISGILMIVLLITMFFHTNAFSYEKLKDLQKVIEELDFQ